MAEGDHAAARLEQTARERALPSASLTMASSASATSTINAGSKSPTHRARDDRTAPVLRVEHRGDGLDELADRLGHGGVAIAPRGRSVVHFDRAGADVREHDLFDEQRDAVGAADDVADEVVGRMRVEQRGDEVGDTARAEAARSSTTSAARRGPRTRTSIVRE